MYLLIANCFAVHTYGTAYVHCGAAPWQRDLCLHSVEVEMTLDSNTTANHRQTTGQSIALYIGPYSLPILANIERL